MKNIITNSVYLLPNKLHNHCSQSPQLAVAIVVAVAVAVVHQLDHRSAPSQTRLALHSLDEFFSIWFAVILLLLTCQNIHFTSLVALPSCREKGTWNEEEKGLWVHSGSVPAIAVIGTIARLQHHCSQSSMCIVSVSGSVMICFIDLIEVCVCACAKSTTTYSPN